ncbi:armadillo-type fold, CLASP N-terminal domain protein [Artemisia annua]|uniref:Armadillo-type fold, CLASP N-terminal domain protein n=1 Tax=Artemisia annua TaxID=35608 RepID=A0A2U1NEB2_ARTAN|nr:armadillo-type fold, CLASP N-terminal domain protein [Artemisia annua]
MMSQNGIRDHMLPKSEKTRDSSSNGVFSNSIVEHFSEKVEGEESKRMDLSVQQPVNCSVEVPVAEVEYIESDKLDDLEDVDKSLKMLIPGLESKDWVLLCETLNNVRRFSIYHKEALQDLLEKVTSLLVKSLKNPRSAVCKTSIMTCADIFKAFGDHVVELLDPLLVQLLLKASQDKRFVCEAAEKALVALTTWVSGLLLLPKLQPYLKNRNPRIRAKASMCFSRSVPRLGVKEIKAFGIDKLIQTAATQLSDQLPESREAARALLLELQNAYEKSPVLAPEPDATSDKPLFQSWEQFCKSNLSKLSAQAVLRVTSVARDGCVSSS